MSGCQLENRCHDIDKGRSKYLETNPSQFQIFHFEWSGIEHGPTLPQVHSCIECGLHVIATCFKSKLDRCLYWLKRQLLSSSIIAAPSAQQCVEIRSVPRSFWPSDLIELFKDFTGHRGCLLVQVLLYIENIARFIQFATNPDTSYWVCQCK